jgi:hypothetical protein
MFRSVWPVEDRPVEMQVEEWFNQMTTDYIFSMKRIWDEKKKKDDKGEETFKWDAALPTRQYDGGPDNCTDLLHPARYDLSRTGFSIKNTIRSETLWLERSRIRKYSSPDPNKIRIRDIGINDQWDGKQVPRTSVVRIA